MITLTVRREDQDITVELHEDGGKWYVIYSVDEHGNQSLLTVLEKANLKARARRGEDETGL